MLDYNLYSVLYNVYIINILIKKQGRKGPLDTPKRIIERREREGEREKERQKERYREGGGDKRERERKKIGERDRERESERESKILAKSLKPRHKAQTKVDYTILSLEIITQNIA